MLALALVATIATANGDGPPRSLWPAGDRLKHFFLSAFVQSVSYSAMRAAGVEHRAALGGGAVVTLAVGVTKEIRDRRTGGFSAGDLAYDAAGAGAAILVLDRTRR